MGLKIHADFPGGNVFSHLPYIDDVDYEFGFVFMPHPHGGPETLWFYFQIDNDEEQDAGGLFDLILRNPQNMLGGYDPRNMRPVYRSDEGDWQRLDAPKVITHDDGLIDAVWEIKIPRKSAQMAFCYPYLEEELHQLWADIHWVKNIIGLSQGGRPLTRIFNSPGSVEKPARPGIYCVARQHSGETSGSWVLDGFLRQMGALGEKAPLVWAVPLSNIDGVMQGDYGKDNFPMDLNRAWGRAPIRHENLVLQGDLERWRKRCVPKAVIDFHAPGACENEGAYTFIGKTQKEYEEYPEIVRWAKHIGTGLGEFAAERYLRVADYASRWDSPSLQVYTKTHLKIVGLTYEFPYALLKDRPLTREDYREIGRRMADSVTELAYQ